MGEAHDDQDHVSDDGQEATYKNTIHPQQSVEGQGKRGTRSPWGGAFFGGVDSGVGGARYERYPDGASDLMPMMRLSSRVRVNGGSFILTSCLLG